MMDLSSLAGAPASLAISVFNVGWFLYVQSHGDTTQADTLVRFGATERTRIWREGESWRLVTSCFLHVGWVHLVWNTYAMFGWCKHAETELGTVPFLLAYLMTGIGASAISVLGHYSISAGASGSGFGMIGVALMVAHRNLGGWNSFFSDGYVLYIIKTTVIWFVLGIFLIRMDNWAHGGGLLFGLLIGYVLCLPTGDPRKLPFLIVVIAIWIGVVLMSLSPRFARRDVNDGT
ncbi:MAG: rhomboid family intramembrane serine protease [Planctomycetes bacterium]|nr:rhomboid family intramembrane serine protease [Planctomycetota bacterium]